MEGFALIKAHFQNNRQIVGVDFDGENNYDLFLKEAKTIFNIPQELEVEVQSQDFTIKPELFTCFVSQYITSSDFVLDIKLRNACSTSTSSYGVDIEDELSNVNDSQKNLIDISDTTENIKNNENTSAIEVVYQAGVSESEVTAPIFQTYTGRRIPIYSEGNNFYVPADFIEELPSTQDIKKINEVKDVLNVPVIENKHRISIAKAIIALILQHNPNRKLIRDDFLQLAQSIVDIFPDEVKETYYVPFQQGHLAKGKLYDAYNNKRAMLSAAGVIRRRVRTKSKDNQTAKKPKTSDIENTDIVNDSDLEILLSENCEEWDLVLANWRKTHSFRQNELKDEDFKTADYFTKYKILSNEKSYELFNIDVKILYPMSKSIYEYKLYYHKIIVKAEKVKDLKVKEILSYIQNTEDEDSRIALSLMLVPYLLPNSKKHNKAEIQESFIFYCKNILHADNEIRARVKSLKIESQPKIYFVGDSKKTICVAYVEICGKRLKFDNPLKAIEVCFNCFIGINIKYPKLSTHVWLFLQKLIFEINTPWDTQLPSVNTLINDLRLNVNK